MSQQAWDAQTKSATVSTDKYREIEKQASEVYSKAVKQAETDYAEAKKQATSKEAKKVAEDVYKTTMKRPDNQTVEPTFTLRLEKGAWKISGL